MQNRCYYYYYYYYKMFIKPLIHYFPMALYIKKDI